MPFVPDSVADFADLTQTITLRRTYRRDDVAVAGCLRRKANIRERGPSAGLYTTTDVVWHLPAADLAEDPPRPGDLIVDADAREWTILRLSLQADSTRYRCYARDLAITYNLDTRISVERYTLAGTPPIAVWHTYSAGVRARIQPLRTRIYADGTTGRTARIFLSGDVDVDHTCRFVATDNTVYTPIVAAGVQPDPASPSRGQPTARHRRRIDRLQEIDVVQQ